MTEEEEQDDLPLRRVNVVEAGGDDRDNWLTCEIGKHIRIDTNSLASYFLAEWQPIVFDGLLLAAAIEFCDRVTRRPKRDWGRSFELKLPVSDPDHWRSPEVCNPLIDALEFLTGDRWCISFVKRRKALPRAQETLIFEASRDLAVLPFSDGLDSHAVAALMTAERGDRLVRVRLGSKKNKGRSVTTPGRIRVEPFTAVPYKVSGKDDYPFPEASARSRGFKFSMLSSLAAFLSKAESVIVPESGQGGLGPALVPVGQAYADYRNHPLFTNRMSVFIEALLGHKVRFEFPRLWFTKAETLKDYLKTTGSNAWAGTRSCWQDHRHASVDGKLRQCGICAACMLRRLSIHAAGLEEAPETYVWENLKAASFEEGAAVGLKKREKVQRAYAIAGTLHLDHLANLTSAPIHAASIRLNAKQVAKALKIEDSVAEQKFSRLLNQHRTEWKAYMAELGPQSFVNHWTSRSS